MHVFNLLIALYGLDKLFSCTGNEVKWRTCVKKMRLMPSPHVEAGAQDYFIITRKQVHLLTLGITLWF